VSKDSVFETFLACQYGEAMALAAQSDLLTLISLGEQRLDRYLAEFRCRGLVRGADAAVVEADRFAVGIWFPSDYLRQALAWEVLTWLGPRNVFHPNISDVAPYICVGRLTPGTPLVDLLYQCFEIITWKKVTMREDDALNHAACVWARAHQSRFPIDPRPLRRRSLHLNVSAKGVGRS
jgi:hypothetical protein